MKIDIETKFIYIFDKKGRVLIEDCGKFQERYLSEYRMETIFFFTIILLRHLSYFLPFFDT